MVTYRFRFLPKLSVFAETLKLKVGHLNLNVVIGDEEITIESLPCWSVRHALAQLKQTDFQCSPAVIARIVEHLQKLEFASELDNRELEERLADCPSRTSTSSFNRCDCTQGSPHMHLMHSRVPVVGPVFTLEEALTLIDTTESSLEEKIYLTRALLSQSLPTAFTCYQQLLAGHNVSCSGISGLAF